MIYCVEDDESIRELELYAIKAAGFSGRGFGSAKMFWEAIAGETPELILLDIMLPGEDGISILKKIRENACLGGIPVIMTTAKGTEYDKVVGLDLGADDYLAKPFGMLEMISRVKAVLRRSASKETMREVLCLDCIAMDTANYIVTVDSVEVELTKKEFDILQLLLLNSEKVIERERLLNRIWGPDYVGESRTVDMHISSLRSKLGTCGEMIKTVRGIGYRLEHNTK